VLPLALISVFAPSSFEFLKLAAFLFLFFPFFLVVRDP
jgi:hypothetical protein